jgi:hypothetical protein
MRTAMTDLAQRFIGVFSKRRQILTEASMQPNEMMTYVNVIRARAFLKITGKSLSLPAIKVEGQTNRLSDELSPLRRIARRGL